MENAVEALKTAAAVLIFGIAITIAFTMFSRAKETADAVVKSQDTQEYLEAADLDSKLYTSSNSIESGTSSTTQGEDPIMTTKGDRIVKIDDVISTIYRYYLEKYGVTIIKSSGEVIARFDSNTEGFVQSWNSDASGKDADGNPLNAKEILKKYAEVIEKNISVEKYDVSIKDIDLRELYKTDGNTTKKFGAPWLVNEKEIIKRINADIGGFGYSYNGQTYEGKKIKGQFGDEKFIEVVNEIDNSQYLQDADNKTSLLQEYQLPTIEIVYIVTKE